MRPTESRGDRRVALVGALAAGVYLTLRAEHERRRRAALAATTRVPATVREVPLRPEPEPAPEPAQEPESPPARRRGVAGRPIVLGILLLAGAGYAASRYLPGNDVTRPRLVAVSSAPVSATTLTTSVTTAPAPAATLAPARSTTAVTPTGFVPARTFLWPAAARARGYQVVFVHDGAVVFRRTTTVPRVVLPPGFRFSAGRYSWSVWALPRAADERPQVASQFVLTAADAAAANERG